jgi:uncharacterized protein (DUF427 family)
MGLSWQQGPLGLQPTGRFLTAEPLPARLLYAEPLRRRMRVQLREAWVADSDDVWLLHEPDRYPVAYFPRADVADVLVPAEHRSTHPDLGDTEWFDVRVGKQVVPQAAWSHVAPPAYATEFTDRVAFRWRSMDAFYEEDERIYGHAADPYHRVDIRASSRRLVVRAGDRIVADSRRPLVLHETGFAPRWYVPRADVDAEAVVAIDDETFCPYKGLAEHWDVAGVPDAAFSYASPYPEAERIVDHISFDPALLDVRLDDRRLLATGGQEVIAHGSDRDLSPAELQPTP